MGHQASDTKLNVSLTRITQAPMSRTDSIQVRSRYKRRTERQMPLTLSHSRMFLNAL